MAILQPLQRAIDFFLTVLAWAYFLFGYFFILLLFFVPFYIQLKRSNVVLQRINQIHLQCFFAWVGFLAPRTKFKIHADVRGLSSSIIICNHISYLDPILLVSLFPRHKTIVKKTFFGVPIFGWFLKKAGYVPSSADEMTGAAMIENLEAIKAHLSTGGNLFVFPEGTRSTDGKLLPFNKGVFSIARYCNAGLKLVFIRDTDKLLQPGTFSFRMQERNTIMLELIASLKPDYRANNFSINAVTEQARQIFERKITETVRPSCVSA